MAENEENSPGPSSRDSDLDSQRRISSTIYEEKDDLEDDSDDSDAGGTYGSGSDTRCGSDGSASRSCGKRVSFGGDIVEHVPSNETNVWINPNFQAKENPS